MGKIFNSVFGGGKSKSKQQSQSTSQSYNQAYPWLQETYAPAVQTGLTAQARLAALLGLGGDTNAANNAYNGYLDSTDYKATDNAGRAAITNTNAARGLLGSGSTLKRLTQFGQENQQKYFTDYLSRLLGTAASGLSAGQLIAGAGSTANSQSTSQGSSSSYNKDGMSKFLGGLTAGG